MTEPNNLDSTDPPPPFDPDTAEPWGDMYDPWFSSPEAAETWEGVSEFADGPQERNLDDPDIHPDEMPPPKDGA